jgi:hypothetical protein
MADFHVLRFASKLVEGEFSLAHLQPHTYHHQFYCFLERIQ